MIIIFCKGERPEIVKNTPKCYMDLMEKCWDPEPFKRPTIKILENTISEWLGCINKYYVIADMIDKEDELIKNTFPSIDSIVNYFFEVQYSQLRTNLKEFA